MRDLFQEGLLYCWKNKNAKLPKGYLQVYLDLLDQLVLNGEKVVSIIDKKHPNLINFDAESSKDPTIDIIDIRYFPNE